MEKKLKIADFAALVGTSAKTIYSRLDNEDNLPDNEQLKSITEKVRGREITFIVTNEDQIRTYQKIFNKLPVTEGNYEEILTDNNVSESINNLNDTSKTYDNHLNAKEVIEQILNLNEVHREELNKVNDELIEYKSKVLLLEDKEGREGYHINEINELRKDKNELLTVNYNQRNIIIGLLAVIVLLIMFIIGYSTYNKKVNELQQQTINIQEPVINDKKPAAAQEVVTPQAPQQAKKVVPNKRK